MTTSGMAIDSSYKCGVGYLKKGFGNLDVLALTLLCLEKLASRMVTVDGGNLAPPHPWKCRILRILCGARPAIRL